MGAKMCISWKSKETLASHIAEGYSICRAQAYCKDHNQFADSDHNHGDFVLAYLSKCEVLSVLDVRS